MNYKTEQENFWAGAFGDDYIKRNDNDELLASNYNLFSEIFSRTIDINSIIEFGANIGMNILPINKLVPKAKTSAVEINEKAFLSLKSICTGFAFLSSILDFDVDSENYDFAFTKGVLIHINPSELDRVYEKLYNISKKYICIIEYFNPTPVTIEYRGEKDRLFKRDFAGELLDKYQDLKLVDYGFRSKRDNNYPQDDLTWFLLEKRK